MATAPQSYTLTEAFREADFAHYVGAGPASLHGQAFLKTVGGDVKTCAGNKVFLMPATPYNTEIIAHASGLTPLANRDANADRFTKSSMCDAEGRFTFDKVPATRWFVVTDVTWGVPTQVETMFGPIVTTKQQGGELVQSIDLKPGAN
jgi:hypothetical protein